MSIVSDFLSKRGWGSISAIVAMLAFILATWFSSSPTPEPKLQVNTNVTEHSDGTKKFLQSKKPLIPSLNSNRKEVREKVNERPKSNLTSLRAIVEAINSSNQDNLGEIYEKLIFVLEKSNASDELKNIVRRWKEPLAANALGNKVVISTIDQYKINGFILFFEAETEALVSASYDFGLGITAIKTFETKQQSPTHLVSVKYITQSGTGLYGESVRIYALGARSITTALDKPYKEYIGGSWGAFKSAVNFEQTNTLAMDQGFPKLTTIGRVTYTNADSKEVQVGLPNEEYIWDVDRSVFMQVSGREVKAQQTMSGIYADYAEPNGNWFEKPRESSDASFSTEPW
jgi:hypothetical protein